jgi:hypothetical protein
MNFIGDGKVHGKLELQLLPVSRTYINIFLESDQHIICRAFYFQVDSPALRGILILKSMS